MINQEYEVVPLDCKLELIPNKDVREVDKEVVPLDYH
jgi:hypothetical protein